MNDGINGDVSLTTKEYMVQGLIVNVDLVELFRTCKVIRYKYL